MVSDASKPVWREAALFDAIITDRRSIVYSSRTTIKTLGMLSMKTCEKCVYRFYVIPAVHFLKFYLGFIAVLQQTCAPATSVQSLAFLS